MHIAMHPFVTFLCFFYCISSSKAQTVTTRAKRVKGTVWVFEGNRYEHGAREAGRKVRIPVGLRKLRSNEAIRSLCSKYVESPDGHDTREAIRSLCSNYIENTDRQEFHRPVVIRKPAVTKIYPQVVKLRNSSGASRLRQTVLALYFIESVRINL